MDFRYDRFRSSVQLTKGLKIYRTTILPRRFFLIPGHALFAAFIRYLPEGLVGTVQTSIPTAFSRLIRPSNPAVVGGLIPTRRYVNPNSILLEEWTLTSDIIYNNDGNPPDSATVKELPLPQDVFYPAIVKTADGKFDAVRTLIDFENLILAGSLDMTTLRRETQGLTSISIDDTVLPSFAVLNNRFAINWEIVLLSYISLVNQNQDPTLMLENISKYVTSMLMPVGAAVPVPPTTTITVGPTKPLRGCEIVSGKAPMAQFICGQLNAGPQWDAIIKGQVRCTAKGFAIADSLIRVAATRIFAVPEQSIMEPIVNSLDAYNPARKVGKFGMGFFSLMYWIMRDPKAKMRMISIYRRPGNPTPCAYGAEISNLNGELQVEVAEGSASFPTTPNQFLVEVDFGSPVDASTVRKFVDQLNRLRYITSAIINVEGNIVNTDAISRLPYDRKQNLPKVNVTLTTNGFSVGDQASGVPIEIFYSSLIVPSISSKTIALSNRKDTGFVPNSRVEDKPKNEADSGYSSFRILVGDIVIMDLRPEEKFTIRTSNILTLPLNTRVPVSRDDVILGSVLPEAEAALEQLFERSINRDARNDVSMLENGLKAFINETASAQNIEIANRFLAALPEMLVKRGRIAVPPTNFYLRQMGAGTPASKPFVTSNNIDLRRLEDHIADNYTIDAASFTNRKTVIITGNRALESADDGGTVSYIFVDADWIRQQGVGWPAKLASEYKTVMLYPTGTPFAESLTEVLRKSLDRFQSKRVGAAAAALAGQYQLALNFREARPYGIRAYLDQDIPSLLEYLRVFYEPFVTEQRLEQFINLLASAVSKCEPRIAVYGTSPTITCQPETEENRFNSMMLTWITEDRISRRPVEREFILQFAGSSPRLKAISDANRELFDKAIFYMIEIESYSIDLAGRFSILGGQSVTPFTTRAELNIPLELIFYFTARDIATARDQYIFDIAFHIFTESRRAYQYILAYIVLFVLLRRLRRDSKIGSSQTSPLTLLSEIAQNTKAVEVARVILSSVDTEFGATPQLRLGSAILYIFMNLGLEATIYDDSNFKHFFHDLYKLALDVYGWLEKRLRVSSLVQEVGQGIPATIPNCYSFTLSQLVSYVFQEELPPTIIQLFDQVSRHQSRVESKLQIIEIATNEGTSKDPIPGKLTETVQNALDAIRSANYPIVTIPNAQIGIVVKKIKGTNDLLLGISDPVGIPLNGLVALSVPFLSGKKPSDIVTGEIGSGFFNVYRDAIGVFISTTVNGETTEILDTPILDAEGKRIIDIQRCARVIKTSAANGTSIFIQSRHTEETFIPAAIEAITFARDTLGLISEAQQVTLNKEPISIELTKVYENDFFEFHMSTRSFGSYIMTKGVPFAPLYRYFTALGLFKNFEWILQRFRMNVRLNVKAGVFTPVQTRTRIGLSDENTNILVASMIKAMPFVILFSMEKGIIPEKEIDNFIQFYSSQTEATDVVPGTSGTSDWFNNFTKLTSSLGINERNRNEVLDDLSKVAYPFMAIALSEKKISVDPSRQRSTVPNEDITSALTTRLMGFSFNPAILQQVFQDVSKTRSTRSNETHADEPNLNNLILEGAKGWPDIGKIQNILRQHIVMEMGLSIDVFPGKMIFNLVYLWLVTKKKSPRRTKKIGPDGKPITEEKDEEEKTTVKNPLHLPFCQVWINTYGRLAQQVILNYPKKTPVVIFDLTIGSAVLGSYLPGPNLLSLGYPYLETVSVRSNRLLLDEIIEVFSGKQDPAAQILQLDIENSVWRQSFMPKGTIAHEMEHFRQGSDHAGGHHDAVTMDLPYGGTKKRIFMIQHHDLMMSLVQRGFYEEVRKAWLAYRQTGKI